MIEQGLIDAHVRARGHVLDAGNSEACGVIRRGPRSRKFLFKTRFGNYFPDETLRCIFENPGWLFGFGVAYDNTSIGIFRLAHHTGEFQRETIRQCHVTVETIYKYRRVWGVLID